MKTVLHSISNVLQGFFGAIAVVLVSVLTVINLVGVFFRFVLNHPLDWTFELSILCFSWIIFLGMGMAFKNEGHMSLTFISHNLPPKAQYVWRQVINVICLAFLVVTLIEGVRVGSSTWGQSYNTIPVSKGLFYYSMMCGSLLGIVNVLCTILDFKVPAKHKGVQP